MLRNDYGLNIVNKIVALAAGFVVSIVLARYLGVVMRGEYAFVVTTASTLAIILCLGFNQSFSYFYKHRIGRGAYRVFVRLFLVQLVIHLFLALIVVLTVGAGPAALIALLLPTLTLYQQFEATLAVVNVRLKIVANIGLSIFRVLGVVAIALTIPAGLTPLVVFHAIMWLSLPVLYIFATRAGVGVAVPWRESGFIVRYSFWPMLTALLVVLNYNLDILFLRALGSPEDLGHYSVAAGVIVYIWAFPDAIKEVVVSRVARNIDASVVLLPLRVSIYGSIVIVAMFALVGRWLVPLAYGDEFFASFSLALILSLGALSMALYKIIGVVMLSDGHRVFYFSSLLGAVVLNTVLNVIFIPRHGAEAAAWSSVAAYTFTGVIFLWYFCYKYRVAFRLLLPSSADLSAIRNVIS